MVFEKLLYAFGCAIVILSIFVFFGTDMGHIENQMMVPLEMDAAADIQIRVDVDIACLRCDIHIPIDGRLALLHVAVKQISTALGGNVQIAIFRSFTSRTAVVRLDVFHRCRRVIGIRFCIISICIHDVPTSNCSRLSFFSGVQFPIRFQTSCVNVDIAVFRITFVSPCRRDFSKDSKRVVHNIHGNRRTVQRRRFAQNDCVGFTFIRIELQCPVTVQQAAIQVQMIFRLCCTVNGKVVQRQTGTIDSQRIPHFQLVLRIQK